ILLCFLRKRCSGSLSLQIKHSPGNPGRFSIAVEATQVRSLDFALILMAQDQERIHAYNYLRHI
ncbi:hypothetical protein, partial [Escherichia coli]|uniref:hypothetical protein n=1 Tax=Escherichia coli TaxID=562 RepID=UPI002FBD4A27